MKRSLVCLSLTLMLLLTLFSTTALAYSENESYGEVLKTDASLTLDGQMDDIYTGALCIPVAQDSQANPLDAPFAYAYLVWQEGDDTQDYLWCYTIVADSYYATNGAQFYERSSVELFLNFENSNDDLDTFQHIVDAAGNAKEYSYVNSIDITVNGFNDEIATVTAADGTEYFSAVASIFDDDEWNVFYAVEYRVPCPKLYDGMEIAYSMTIHDFPEGGWYFAQSSLSPANWDADSYDYFVIADQLGQPNPDYVHPLIVIEDETDTEAPDATDPQDTQAPETNADTKPESTDSDTKAPAATDKTEQNKVKTGCSALITAPLGLLALPLLFVKKKKT